MPRTSYAIALGSNRRHGRHGTPEKVIAAALAALEDEGVRIVRTSPVIRTAALGPAGRGFANAAAIIECDLDPPALLDLLKRAERAFGRRRGRRWGARVLDLDIILWSGGSWPAFPRHAAPGRLNVPHCELSRRAFVLDPLLRVAPDWRHPLSGRTVRQMRARLAGA
ncbi:MAG: 2-amino-4-hydroxy-6-hydroxymethyldihydropteridine diphosphokinase [Sphingomonadaceae bacterium]